MPIYKEAIKTHIKNCETCLIAERVTTMCNAGFELVVCYTKQAKNSTFRPQDFLEQIKKEMEIIMFGEPITKPSQANLTGVRFQLASLNQFVKQEELAQGRLQSHLAESVEERIRNILKLLGDS